MFGCGHSRVYLPEKDAAISAIPHIVCNCYSEKNKSGILNGTNGIHRKIILQGFSSPLVPYFSIASCRRPYTKRNGAFTVQLVKCKI